MIVGNFTCYEDTTRLKSLFAHCLTVITIFLLFEKAEISHFF